MTEMPDFDAFEAALNQLSEEKRSAFVAGEHLYALRYNQLLESNPQHEPSEAEIFSAMSESVDVFNYARALQELESRLTSSGQVDQENSF